MGLNWYKLTVNGDHERPPPRPMAACPRRGARRLIWVELEVRGGGHATACSGKSWSRTKSGDAHTNKDSVQNSGIFWPQNSSIMNQANIEPPHHRCITTGHDKTICGRNTGVMCYVILSTEIISFTRPGRLIGTLMRAGRLHVGSPVTPGCH